MERFTIGWTTIPGVADSDFLDRLADIVYEVDEIDDAVMFLNDDGSVTSSIDINATDALSAVEQASELFFDAFVKAAPLRLPLPGELEAANEITADRVRQLQTQREQAKHLLSSINADLSARLPGGRVEDAVPA